eukprot:CAMPEP_0174821660 /NCGR_PEP_ID=MMETSP1107-20130205/9162_1 /TAXON_ID=36770 /ORGANISM="Paraphysomonas vestita, Strain GFlagA" /LENGTH=85 /DNA_ID=CAMNT_0016038941 /DNA_START=403 /DNA_END=660 /DNA_ORIENTATION=+
MHNKASYRYIREDGAQSKKSYEDKYGAKGSKSSKGSKGSKGSAVKEEVYIDDDDLGADVKSESKSSRGAKGSAKEVVWSKEEDYF